MDRKCSLLDLDDGCLVNIFGRLDPLPHLFEVSAVCKVSVTSDTAYWQSSTRMDFNQPQICCEADQKSLRSLEAVGKLLMYSDLL